MELSFGSLFAGIGGIDLGFERAGMVCKWQVEIEPYCQKVLAKHWPDVRRHDDVRTWPQPDTEPVDVIAGGFPCQDISYAGKGAGLAGERSGLFYEVARIVSEMGPRFVVLENVAALLTRGMGDVLGTLASLGYDAEWHCIPAAAVGAPHIRDRAFILAYTEDSQRWAYSGTAEPRRTQHGQQFGRPTCRAAPRNNRWATEPDVGGGLDGFSTWLDRSGRIDYSHNSVLAHGDVKNAATAKKRAKEAMRALRDRIGSEAFQWKARGFVSVPSSAVLLAYLREFEKRAFDETRLFVESPQALEEGVRELWAYKKPASSPHRPGCDEQRRSKHSNAVQTLSRLLAHDCEKAWLEYRGTDAAPSLSWECGIARVADGVSNRVDRLRGLGNAVVPQVAEYIGRQIVDANTRSHHD